MIYTNFDMKKHRTRWFVLLILFVLTGAWLLLRETGAEEMPANNSFVRTSGTAVVITGAAARIPQEAALLQHLHQNGWLNDVCFISGTSSGALNAVMLNAILSHRYSWNQYIALFRSIDNGMIFTPKGRKLPVDTEPLRQLIQKMVCDTLGFKTLGNLPFPTAISISQVRVARLDTRAYRLSNMPINADCDPKIDLTELLMASTSIPVFFPSVKIASAPALNDIQFIDGGFGEDHVPFTAVLQYENYCNLSVDTLLIISRKSETDMKTQAELDSMGITQSRFNYKMELVIDNYTKSGFIKDFKLLQENYPQLAAKTYIYIPDFQDYFPLLNFQNLSYQFEVTSKWADLHQPVPLKKYLEMVSLEHK